MFTTVTPNMNLVVPVVGQEPGPDWATDINVSLSLIDSHDHSPGYGVQITPSGININTDFPLNANDLTLVRSVRFDVQSSPLAESADLACVYALGDDLYYNDAIGNVIRMTQNGSVAGATGSISGLTSPASASYVAGNSTFVWQSDALTAANLDAASILLRNPTMSSAALTLSPPNALTSDYTIVLPTLPPGERFLTIDNSGNMAATRDVDNTTIEVSSNLIQVKNASIDYTKLTPRPVGATVAASGIAISAADTGALTAGTTGGVFVPIGPMGVTITTTGRPLLILVVPADPAAAGASNGSFFSTGAPGGMSFVLKRNTSDVGYQRTLSNGSYPAGSLSFVDFPAAGTYNYQLFYKASAATNLFYLRLLAYELL